MSLNLRDGKYLILIVFQKCSQNNPIIRIKNIRCALIFVPTFDVNLTL